MMTGIVWAGARSPEGRFVAEEKQEATDLESVFLRPEENQIMAIAREQDIIQWASERGIFDKATPHSQHGKTLEEVQELTDALNANDASETKDAIGDIAVTLIIQAHMHGWTLGECLEAAYQEIKGRKGQMVDGVFVKE